MVKLFFLRALASLVPLVQLLAVNEALSRTLHADSTLRRAAMQGASSQEGLHTELAVERLHGNLIEPQLFSILARLSASLESFQCFQEKPGAKSYCANFANERRNPNTSSNRRKSSQLYQFGDSHHKI